MMCSCLVQLCRRYAAKVAALRGVFSEYGLIRARVLVEVRWALGLHTLTPEACLYGLRGLITNQEPGRLGGALPG